MENFQTERQLSATTMRSRKHAVEELLRLSIVLATKIVGAAAAMMMELPTEDRTWDSIIVFMDDRFKPRGSTCDLMYTARGIKVNSVKEIMDTFKQIKLQANEIIAYNNEPRECMSNFDKELVKIVKTKLHTSYQMQVNDTHTLEQVDRHFSQYDAYNAIEAIRFTERASYKHTTPRNPQQQITYNQTPYRQYANTTPQIPQQQHTPNQHPYRQYANTTPPFTQQQQTHNQNQFKPQTHNANANSGQYRPQYMSRQQVTNQQMQSNCNSGQFRQTNPFHLSNSAQFRQSNAGQYRQNQGPIAIAVDNITPHKHQQTSNGTTITPNITLTTTVNTSTQTRITKILTSTTHSSTI